VCERCPPAAASAALVAALGTVAGCAVAGLALWEPPPCLSTSTDAGDDAAAAAVAAGGTRGGGGARLPVRLAAGQVQMLALLLAGLLGGGAATLRLQCVLSWAPLLAGSPSALLGFACALGPSAEARDGVMLALPVARCWAPP
jgi:hypothetical protein